MRSRIASLAGAAALLLVPALSAADDFALRRVATGLTRPLFVTAPPGDTGRVFIVEQRSGSTGRVKILRLATQQVLPTPFLEVTGVSTGNEQGLLGLAFHPDYASNGYLYVDFTDAAGTTVIRRYTVSADPNQADPSSAQVVLTISQPQENHNGGWLAFGPDGYLYVAMGDGGGSDDNDAGHTVGTGNAQDLTSNLLGKILRLDVDGDAFPADPNRNYAIPPDNPFVGVTGDDEIWAYGLRNPFRASFDRLTGDLYIGDVGQNSREEIDVQPATSAGGENYGWRLREGTIATPTGGVGGAKPPGAIDPIYDYPHGTGPTQGFVVTGGVVYRGPVASLQGLYVFADFQTARIWTLRWDGSDPAGFDGTNYTEFTDWGDAPQFQPDAGALTQISSFGEDAAGNLYVVSLTGDVFRVTALPPPVPALAPGSAALLGGGLALSGIALVRRRRPAR
jgi:glucose/arabinose dehydrogenase